MRTETRNRSHSTKSRWKKDVVMTVEEAEKLVECDPEVIQRLETLLVHAGFRKREIDGGQEAS